MHSNALLALGLLLPLLGTSLGAAGALLRRAPIRESLLLGFSSGVMLAASVWSLLLPAMDYAAEAGSIRLSPILGFLLGAATVPLLQRFAPKQEQLLLYSVTLHNIPEGMAVGVALAAAAVGGEFAPALLLAFAIGVQNMPEGWVVTMPLLQKGMSRGRACAVGILSGVVEPVFAAAALWLAGSVARALPWVLSAAAGCMYLVTVESLLPAAAQEDEGAAAAAVGFALMMLLDVAFG